jgi:hypothetical protein
VKTIDSLDAISSCELSRLDHPTGLQTVRILSGPHYWRMGFTAIIMPEKKVAQLRP